MFFPPKPPEEQHLIFFFEIYQERQSVGAESPFSPQISSLAAEIS